MLYKMHLCPEEIAAVDQAMKDYITLTESPTDAAERAARKIALLRDYVDLSARVGEAVQAQTAAKEAYNEFTFRRENLPRQEIECKEVRKCGN